MGNQNNTANYYRISCVRKVLKRLHRNKRWLQGSKLHLLCSHNSVPGINCLVATAAVTEYMRSEIDKKAQGQGCFIELQQKVSDTLDQKDAQA